MLCTPKFSKTCLVVLGSVIFVNLPSPCPYTCARPAGIAPRNSEGVRHCILASHDEGRYLQEMANLAGCSLEAFACSRHQKIGWVRHFGSCSNITRYVLRNPLCKPLCKRLETTCRCLRSLKVLQRGSKSLSKNSWRALKKNLAFDLPTWMSGRHI